MMMRTRTRNALAAAAVALAGLPVMGQDAGGASAPQQAAPSARSGLIGQKAAFPNVLGRDRSLPIERHITLPGLPATPVVVAPGNIGVPAVVGRPGVVVGDGLQVNGDYRGDKWNLHLHLGSGATILEDGRVYYPYASRRYYWRDGRVYSYPGWYYYRPSYYYSNRPVDGVLTQQVDYSLRTPQVAQPQPAPEAPAPELTALEKARLFMAADDLDRAIQYYREHLDEDAEDVGAMRAMGVAMVEAGRLEDGVAMIALAYRTDPLLARTPLDLATLGLDGRRYDNLLSRTLHFARRVDSGSAHLAGAVLLQADGKVAGAGRVLDRAEKAGLDDEVLDPMRRELGVPVRGG